MENIEILKMCGWYMIDNYYTSPKLVSDPHIEDYRKYRLTLEEALNFEVKFINNMNK
jgi:hypothetical protein